MDGMVTLKSACEEALRRGFTTIWIPEVGIHENLTEHAEDLSEGGPEEYIIFGTLILRVTDAWKEDAEMYELD